MTGALAEAPRTVDGMVGGPDLDLVFGIEGGPARFFTPPASRDAAVTAAMLALPFFGIIGTFAFGAAGIVGALFGDGGGLAAVAVAAAFGMDGGPPLFCFGRLASAGAAGTGGGGSAARASAGAGAGAATNASTAAAW